METEHVPSVAFTVPAAASGKDISADELKSFINYSTETWKYLVSEKSLQKLTPALKRRLETGIATFNTATSHLDVADLPAMSAKLHNIDDEINAHWSRIYGSPRAYANVRSHLATILNLVYVGYMLDYVETIGFHATKVRAASKQILSVSDACSSKGLPSSEKSFRESSNLHPATRDLTFEELEIKGEELSRCMEWINMLANLEEDRVNTGSIDSTLQPIFDSNNPKKLEAMLDLDYSLLERVFQIANELELLPEAILQTESFISLGRDYFKNRYVTEMSKRKGMKIEKVETTRTKKAKKANSPSLGKNIFKEITKLFSSGEGHQSGAERKNDLDLGAQSNVSSKTPVEKKDYADVETKSAPPPYTEK